MAIGVSSQVSKLFCHITLKENIVIISKVKLLDFFFVKFNLSIFKILQGRTVETFEWAEEAKSRDVRNKDPRYQRLLKARALDPLSQKKLSSVQSKFMYLEQQMDEVNTKLDMEWDAHLEKCKV